VDEGVNVCVRESARDVSVHAADRRRDQITFSMAAPIRIDKVSPLETGQSNYVKPMRVFFKQVSSFPGQDLKQH
jgi:hypothetical protein